MNPQGVTTAGFGDQCVYQVSPPRRANEKRPSHRLPPAWASLVVSSKTTEVTQGEGVFSKSVGTAPVGSGGSPIHSAPTLERENPPEGGFSRSTGTGFSRSFSAGSDLWAWPIHRTLGTKPFLAETSIGNRVLASPSSVTTHS